jgi:hypothetical protein
VRWIDNASFYLQNRWLAGLTLIGMNIVCFEIVLSIYRLVNFFLNRNSPYELLSETERNERAFGLGVVFVATLGLTNWVFCKILLLPLSIGNMIAISLPTGLIYLFWKTRIQERLIS